MILDGSEAPIKVEAEALLASEKLVPVAVLNKVLLCGDGIFSFFYIYIYIYIYIYFVELLMAGVLF